MDIGVWLLFTAYVYTFEEEHFFNVYVLQYFLSRLLAYYELK